MIECDSAITTKFGLLIHYNLRNTNRSLAEQVTLVICIAATVSLAAGYGNMLKWPWESFWQSKKA